MPCSLLFLFYSPPYTDHLRIVRYNYFGSHWGNRCFKTNTIYMKVTETMIEEFFRNELNDYQQELVKEYFRQYPEALQKYLTEKSWNDFNPNENLATPVADKMFRIIASGSYRKNKIRRIVFQSVSVAAVLFALCVGIYLLTIRKNTTAHVPTAP